MLSGPVALPTDDCSTACPISSSKISGRDKSPSKNIGMLVLLGSSYNYLMYLPQSSKMSLVSMMILPDSSMMHPCFSL